MEYGLLGETLAHSYSPRLHALLAPYRYELCEVKPEALDGFLRRADFQGLNVTIPYKQAVIPYCAALSEAARETGAVNTLLKRPDGTLFGHNTDIGGFLFMLRGAGIAPEGQKAVVLGSGGTSHTVCAALRRLRAREITVISRRGPENYEALYQRHGDAELLVNATPVGMYPHTDASPAALDRLPALRAVAEVIYNPRRTRLTQEAQARGLTVAYGLQMLVAQAREAAELFMGREIAPARVGEAVAALRLETENLVLTGMPGCGKSTLGRLLARRLRRPFVDLDARVEAEAGMSIPELMARYGEARFREWECRAALRAGSEGGQVIATGGGAMLREENARALRQNGVVCFVRRPLSQLACEGRPLSSSEDAVRALWEARRARYLAAADFTVDNDGKRESAVKAIEEGFYEAVGAQRPQP